MLTDKKKFVMFTTISIITLVLWGAIGTTESHGMWYNTRQDITNMLRDNPSQAKQDLQRLLDGRTREVTDENGNVTVVEDMTHFNRLGITPGEMEEMVE
jgi:hypothetical protein